MGCRPESTRPARTTMGNVGGRAVARGRSEGSGGWMWVVPVVGEHVHVPLCGCHAGTDSTASTAAGLVAATDEGGPSSSAMAVVTAVLLPAAE